MALNSREKDDVSIADPRIAALYREVATEEPSGKLDETIAREARNVEATASRRVPFIKQLMAWRLPLVTAALAVVTANLVVLVLDRGDDSRVDAAAEASADAQPEAREEPRASFPRYEAHRPSPGVSTRPTRERRGTDSLAERSMSPPDSSASTGDASDAAPPREAVAAASPSSPASVATAPAAAAGEPRRPREERASAPRRADSGLEQQVPSVLIAELDREPPGRWVERIQTLRRDGRRGEADALLREFTRRYGDAAVPPALKSDE
jgi:hypothetical protein